MKAKQVEALLPGDEIQPELPLKLTAIGTGFLRITSASGPRVHGILGNHPRRMRGVKTDASQQFQSARA
jgi:hypothetical protein